MKASIPVVVFIVFLTLKLVGVIAWSWWWVTAPLWISSAVGLLMMLFVAAVALVVELGKGGRK